MRRRRHTANHWIPLRNLRRYGLPAYAAGGALLCNVLQGWQAGQDPTRQLVLSILAALGLSAVAFGVILTNRALRTISPGNTAFFQHWPIVNLSVWTTVVRYIATPGDTRGPLLIARRLGRSILGTLIILGPTHSLNWLVIRLVALTILCVSADLACGRMERVLTARTQSDDTAVG
jgi:hypothetical protein